VFRRLLGYLRYDKEEEKKLLEQIYLLSGLDYNFFQPNMKLVSRERIGSRVIKRHGLPKNPLPGIIRIAGVSPEEKNRLRKTCHELNLVKLKTG